MWVCSNWLDAAYPLHMRQHHLRQEHTNPQPYCTSSVITPALLVHSLLQLRKPGIILLPLGIGFAQQSVDLLLRPDHDPVLIGDDQVAIPDEDPPERDRAADDHRTLFV